MAAKEGFIRVAKGGGGGQMKGLLPTEQNAAEINSSGGADQGSMMENALRIV